ILSIKNSGVAKTQAELTAAGISFDPSLIRVYGVYGVDEVLSVIRFTLKRNSLTVSFLTDFPGLSLTITPT
ncbi:MAG: hypothetical protein KDI02_17400, partial [Anaerolineae bacterium]|nr:hypothetical protein [Anaerolineae bacterium]